MKKISMAVTVLSIFIASISYALDVETHKAINAYIAQHALSGFSLDSYLKNQLGIQSGIKEQFSTGSFWTNTERAWEWVRDGGRYEDKPVWYPPYLRSVNHFHDPLAAQLTAAGFSGIWGTGSLSGLSAIKWSQRPLGMQTMEALGSGNYSWYDVRDYFYKALTLSGPTARNTNFAKTFRGLGQQMHLVQDMSVPEHARDDGHYLDAYEEFVKSKPEFVTSATTTPVSVNIAALGQPSIIGIEAPVPIANLFDTNQYNGTNPAVTMNQNIGLSEYTNANFVSADTLFRNFPYPSLVTSVTATNYIIPDPVFAGSTVTRAYYKKTSDGDSGYRLAGVGYLALYLDENGIDPNTTPYTMIAPMDGNVYGDYAQRLLPRAVGYSAGLLNYFFRGNIEIALPARGIYSSATASAPGFTTIKVLAKNTTPNNEEMSDPINGSIKLVVRYKLAHEDPFQSLDVATDEEFTYLTASEVNNARTIPRDSTVELTFDLSQTPLPFWATDVYLQIVYRGKLGNEDGAVAVGFKDISEPTPIDLYNNMDRLCLNGGWYITESQEAIDQAPGGWDIYPHKIEGSHLKISFAEDTAYASPSNYTFSPETIMPGTLYRAYVLSDYDYLFTYSDYTPAVPIRSQDTADHSNAILIGSIAASAIKNQVDYQVTNETDCAEVGATAPCDIRYYPLFYTFRGTNIWGPAGFIVDNPKYPVNTSCSWELLN